MLCVCNDVCRDCMRLAWVEMFALLCTCFAVWVVCNSAS